MVIATIHTVQQTAAITMAIVLIGLPQVHTQGTVTITTVRLVQLLQVVIQVIVHGHGALPHLYFCSVVVVAFAGEIIKWGSHDHLAIYSLISI